MSLQDPKRTKYCKARKLVARKKRDAFIHRKEKQDQKERNKFKPRNPNPGVAGNRINKSSLQPQHITKTHQCQDRDLTKNHIDSVPLTECIYNGLKGGAPKIKKPPKKSDQLQLRNGGTDCFVNSVIQLLRKTGYMTFIKDYQQLISGP
jgi:hypothetical protein